MYDSLYEAWDDATEAEQIRFRKHIGSSDRPETPDLNDPAVRLSVITTPRTLGYTVEYGVKK